MRKKTGAKQAPKVVVVKMTPLIVTVTEAAKLLACSRRLIQQLIRSHELVGFIEGNKYKVTVTSLEDYVARKVGDNRLGSAPLKPHQISEEMENEYRTESET
jgi:excisionase family DNA binding protein